MTKYLDESRVGRSSLNEQLAISESSLYKSRTRILDDNGEAKLEEVLGAVKASPSDRAPGDNDDDEEEEED